MFQACNFGWPWAEIKPYQQRQEMTGKAERDESTQGTLDRHQGELVQDPDGVGWCSTNEKQPKPEGTLPERYREVVSEKNC